MGLKKNKQHPLKTLRQIRDRKKNLFKKAEELSILCGVDVCLILEHCQRNHNVVETWPPDPEKVKAMINAYKASPASIKNETNENPAAATRHSSVLSSEPKSLEEIKAGESRGKAIIAHQSNPAAATFNPSVFSSEPKGLRRFKAGGSRGKALFAHQVNPATATFNSSDFSSEPKGLLRMKAGESRGKAVFAHKRNPATATVYPSASSSEPKGLVQTRAGGSCGKAIFAHKTNPAAATVYPSVSLSKPMCLVQNKAGGPHGGCQNDVDSDKKREMLYPTWDEQLDYCSEEELIKLLAALDAKLQGSAKRIDNEQQRFRGCNQ